MAEGTGVSLLSRAGMQSAGEERCTHGHVADWLVACASLQTSISLPFITATADGPKHIETNLSRAKFEELASDLLDRCRVPVEQALKDANLSVKDLNEVILVGGSTRIPAVQVPPPPRCLSWAAFIMAGRACQCYTWDLHCLACALSS